MSHQGSISNHPRPPQYLFFLYMESWRLELYSSSATLAPGSRLSAEMNRLLSLTLPLRWQESWLVTTLGILFTAAARIGCRWSVLQMITADLRIVKGVFFHAQTEPGYIPSLQGHTGTWASSLTRLHIQSPLPNELYKFNHVEGCLVQHQVLIRVSEGRGLISSPAVTRVLSMTV